MASQSRDVVVAAAFAVLALIFVVEGASLPFVSHGTPGPGLFPLLLAVAILVVAAALVARAVLRHRSERVSASTRPPGGEPAIPPGEAGDEDRHSVRRPLLLWGIVLLACIALPVIGFLPAMLLLSLILLLGLERRVDVATVVSAVAVPVACYLLFAVLLDVRLPAGLLG